MKLAIIGAGWAGMAAAVEATTAGHRVSVFEASHSVGGRARAVTGTLPDGTPVNLDNGQHILIGAYAETLRLMRQVGVDERTAMLRLPMTLLFPDGRGMQFPDWPAPLDALAGILAARGWSVSDKWSMLRLASRWRRQDFQCGASTTVARLCQSLSPRVIAELIEPLCLSALNTAIEDASAQVFLRVLKDAMFGTAGGSNLLLPRVDLSELFPAAAARWLAREGGQLRIGARVDSLAPQGSGWQVQGEGFDAVLLATSAAQAIRLLRRSSEQLAPSKAGALRNWAQIGQGLQFDPICTVYAWGAAVALPRPMLALRTGADAGAPAQFVFDRGQLGGPPGLLAFVASASQGERATLQAQVLAQARQQLGLALTAVLTIVEKRAAFACTPALQRPDCVITAGLLACGDYVAGAYPATLEGAVRSAVTAVQALSPDVYDDRAGITGNKEHRQ
ncbi:MAG: hydroxysqualene dehydroxylase HpnE [Rhodoferax sp.]